MPRIIFHISLPSLSPSDNQIFLVLLPEKFLNPSTYNLLLCLGWDHYHHTFIHHGRIFHVVFLISFSLILDILLVSGILKKLRKQEKLRLGVLDWFTQGNRAKKWWGWMTNSEWKEPVLSLQYCGPPTPTWFCFLQFQLPAVSHSFKILCLNFFERPHSQHLLQYIIIVVVILLLISCSA